MVDILAYAPETFDVITCMNVLHDLSDPVAVLAGLRRLLAPEGQLVVEDFARREFPFPWAVFENFTCQQKIPVKDVPSLVPCLVRRLS